MPFRLNVLYLSLTIPCFTSLVTLHYKSIHPIKTNGDILMKIYYLTIILLLSMFLFCLSIRTNANEQSNDTNMQQDKTFFDEIRDLATKMEVFPVDIYAQNCDGPLGKLATVPKYEKRGLHSRTYVDLRYELTFNRFLLMFDFKECVYHATIQDIDDCIHRIDEMTPKEKALLLTALYIFEYRHHRYSLGDYFYEKTIKHYNNYIEKLHDRGKANMVKFIKDYYLEERSFGKIIGYKPDDSMNIDNETWSRWLAVLEKYKEFKTVAFPAIDTPFEELKKEWEINIEQCKQVLRDRWQLDVVKLYDNETYRIAFSDQYFPRLESLAEKSPQEARLLFIYSEYFDVLYLSPQPAIIPYDRNSSEFPKTLGDIATQILMSRLNYDDIPDTGMLE